MIRTRLRVFGRSRGPLSMMGRGAASGPLLCLAVLVAPVAVGCAAETVGPSGDHSEGESIVAPDAIIDQWRTEGEWRVSPVLEAAGGASRVGVLVALQDTGALPALEARATEGGEPVGDWQPVGATWGEEDTHVGVAELGEQGDGAQLRIRESALERIRHLRWNAVIPAPAAETTDGAADEEVSAAREALRSELSGLGIVTREEWGARATRCSSHNPDKYRMAVHYTVTPSENPERQVRAIQRYHQDSRGWCDVGYHFLVGVDGTVYEGRPLHLRGAHVGGHNTGNIGVAFVGCFDPAGACDGWGPRHPPDVMLEGAASLIGALGDLYGIEISPSQVKGHRDHSGASTSCPGQYLYDRLGDLRALARSSEGGKADSGSGDSGTDGSGTTGGSCTHSYGGEYDHLGCSDGWQCCDGSWRTRGACGSCACVEESGTSGCGL